MKFIDREKELELLEREYKRPDASLFILYGRRRVGKTALIKEFIRGKKALYFLATEESEAMNRQAFQLLAADFLQDELLEAARIDRWEPLFKRLGDAAKGEKLVLVMDEFQYIGKNNPAFLSVFQKIWDSILSPSNVMVILCGSLISMMQSQTLNYSSPLYGRRTGQLKLRGIPFSYYGEFFPGEMGEDRLAEYYSITGGIPKYIELFRSEKGLVPAVQENLLSPSSFLFQEPNFLLQKEVEEIGSYFSLLRVIAAGNHKLSKIAGVLQQKQSSLPRYLKVLMDLDILEREVPVTEGNPEKSKKGLYQIQDNFLRFWFQFIYPYMSYIEMGHTDVVLRYFQQHFIDRQVGFTYEKICQEKLWTLSAAGKLPGLLEKVGRWWDNQHEIDVAGISEQDRLLVLGECKFWKGPVGLNVLQALEEKAAFVNWQKGQRHTVYLLFSIHGFTPDLEKVAAARKDLLLLS